MVRNNVYNNKNSLLAQKEKLLQEIKYYEQQIEEFPTQNSSLYFDGDSSSDSENDFPKTLDLGPSISMLKKQQESLRTCLQATEELTSIVVLQSEVNLMLNDPVIIGEKLPLEPGTWREVSAECIIDLVPFSITFYTHQPSRKFAAMSYRGLKVLPVKSSHEVELSKSVLSSLTNPGDAVEVLRSYATAYRSRRMTLARLADRYSNALFMEPRAEGGFVLKCANTLVMSWCLVNKTSALTPFRHQMSFQMEYMDSSYLKIIKQAHRELSNPSLQTDERTLLLSKIISTCLEAQKPTQEYESMESESESVKRLEKTTLEDDDNDDYEIEGNINRQDDLPKRDEEVMAPPKSLPKKGKPKGKENKGDNRMSLKRGLNQVDDNNVKKAKIDIANAKQSDATNDGGKIKEKIVTKHNGKERVSERHNIDEVAVKNHNVTENVTKQKHTAKEKQNNKPKNNETVKKAGKITEKLVSDDKIEDKSKNTKNKEAKDDVKTTKNKEQSNKDSKIDKTSKTGPGKSTGVSKTTNPANKNERETSNRPDNHEVSKRVNKNVNTEQNAALPTKKSTIDKKAQASAKLKSDEITANNKNKGKKLEQGKPKTTNEKSEPQNIAKNSDTKEANDKNKPKAKRKLDTPNTVEDNAQDVNSGLPNAKNSVNSKKNTNSDSNTNKIDVNTKKTDSSELKNYEAPSKKTINSANANKNVISTKKNIDSNKNSETKKTISSDVNAKKDNSNGKTEARVKTSNILTKNKDNIIERSETKTANPNKDPESSKVKNANDTEKSKPKNFTKHNIVPVKNVANKNVSSDSKNTDPHKNIATHKNFFTQSRKVIKSNANIQETSKNVVKNMTHRNFPNKMCIKSINIKSFHQNVENGIITKIPQKKISPAYAAALKRMSPRTMSTFKCPSDSNIQAKIFKPITNIPRLLKKPAPKSK